MFYKIFIFSSAQAIACKREFSDVFDSREFFSIVQSRKDKIAIKYDDLHFCIKLKKKSIVSSGDIKIKKVSVF